MRGRVLASGGAVVVGLALLAAWPLGLYDRWRAPCRTLFTPSDARRLGIPDFVVSRVDQDERSCVMVGTPSAENFTPIVTVSYRFDPLGDGFTQSVGDWDREAPYVTRTPIAGLGDEATLIDHRPHPAPGAGRALGDVGVYVHRAHTTAYVNLGAGHYSRADALAVVELLKTRPSKLDRY